MKRYIISFVFLLATTLVFGQTATRKGFYNAHRGDSIGINRTTKDKAIMDCYGLSLTNTNKEEIYYTLPDRFVVEFPVIEMNFSIDAVWIKDVTETSVTIEVQLNRDDLESVYVRFRKVGGLWQRTNSDPASVYWIGLLDSLSDYEYMIYAEDSNGTKINSDLLTFKTK